MSKYIVILAIFLNFQALGNDLSQGEANDLATDLDNICGDSWCEGDFNWSVDEFTCSFEKKTCSVDLTLIEEFFFDEDYGSTREEFRERKEYVSKVLDVDYESYDDMASIHWRQSCKFENITSKDMLFDQSGWASYSDLVYERVLDCVTEMEEKYWSL